MMGKTTTFNLTDLTTMEALLQAPHDGSSIFSRSWKVLSYVGSIIQDLNVTLRLPLVCYAELEHHNSSPCDGSTVMPSAATLSWIAMWQAICDLQHLSRLHVWLDHENQSSWSLVNERLVLSDVFNILEERLKAHSQEKTFDVHFNMPKLHPRLSSPATHFSEASHLPSFKIERRFRQRYHSIEWAPQQFNEVLKADFPILWEIGEMEQEFGMTMEELEDYEKMMWDRGDDVERFALEIYGLENVHYEPM